VKRKKKHIVSKAEILDTPQKVLSPQHFSLKFFVSLTVVISSLFILSGVLAANEVVTRSYIGKQTFDNREEAEAFQCDVYREAFDIGASIYQNIIVNQPLPTVHFHIISPAERRSVFGDEPVPFKYGKASTRFNSITALILVSLFLIGSFWFIWSKRGQRMFAESEMWQDGTLVFAVSLLPGILLLCSLLYVMQVFILEKL